MNRDQIKKKKKKKHEMPVVLTAIEDTIEKSLDIMLQQAMDMIEKEWKRKGGTVSK